MKNEGFPLAEDSRARLMGTIRGANGGYPFYFYLGDDIDPGEIDPAYAYRWSNTADDYGIHILVASISVIGRLLDKNFLVDTATPYQALTGLFLLTALLFLWPTLPLPISIGGILALSVGIFFGPMKLTTTAQTWGVTYAALLAGMMVVTATLPKKNVLQISFVLLLSLLMGFAQFLRQESAGTIYAAGLGLLAVTGLMAGVAFVVQRDEVGWRQTAFRASISAICVLAAVIIAPFILRAVYSAAWNTPYSKTVVQQHGRGLPLYVGTGYISNPYNIVWLDLQGVVHVQLYDAEVSTRLSDPEFQDTLQKAWLEVVSESPWLVLQNIREKATFVHHFLLYGEPPYPTAFSHSRQTDLLQVLYPAAVFILVAAGIWLIFQNKPEAVLIFAGCLAVIPGAWVGPLSGFPSYIAGPQGGILVVVFLLPAALLTPSEWDSSKVVRGMLAAGAGLFTVGVILAAGFIWMRWQGYQNEQDNMRDPLTEIQNREFRYAPFFNDLSRTEQEAVLKKLVDSNSPQIILPVETSLPADYFEVKLAVLTENQLHVLVWLGENYPPPAAYINQARVYSLVQVCINCETLAHEFEYDRAATLYTFLNLSDWNNEYRLLSFAVAPEAVQQADFLLVGVQGLVNWGGGATQFGYQVEDQAAAKLVFQK